LLAQYTYHAEQRGKRIRAVNPHPQLYRTTDASPQLELGELDDDQWRKVFQRPLYQRHLGKAPETHIQQLALPMVGPTVGLAVALLIVVFG
jgi:hypothetical protein